MLKYLIFGICIAGIIVFYEKKIDRIYRQIDGLLNNILNHEEITDSDLEEGRRSAVVSKIKRIQEISKQQLKAMEREKQQIQATISDLSHQIKTPMANIFMYFEMMDDEQLSVEHQKKFYQKIKKQLEKLEWITNSLFKMIKLEQNVIDFDSGYFSIKETLIHSIESVLKKLESKEIEIITQIDEDIMLYHNVKWTEEVFINLLENAIKYTSHGGMISIRTIPFEVYTQIEIQDNGIGIDTNEITKIFDRFFRGSNATNIEGSGIGLYLSKMIIEREKGYITVKSECGKGSSFSVFLQNCRN